MKNNKGFIGLAAFMACLWAVVVTTYANQVNNQGADGKNAHLLPMQDASCSSSSSSGGE